jgi:hypothetical protein
MYTAAAIDDAEVIDVDAEQSDTAVAAPAVVVVPTVPASIAVLPDADPTGASMYNVTFNSL